MVFETIKKLDYPNGVKEQYQLTSGDFIDVMTDSGGGNQLFKFDYGYNELGDRDSLTFYISRPLQTAYPRSLYAKTNKYTYDKTGNRLKKIAGTDTTNYSYNKRNNQLTGEGGNVYAYDDNGNLTEIHLTEAIIDYYYTWDFENRLTQVKRAGSGGNDSLRMTYCGLGKRIRKIHGIADTTNYAFDGMYAVCEFSGHLDIKAKYVYANGMLLARYDASPADSHYYHHDGLGSTMGMTNENGSVEQSYFYDEFGNSLGSWGSVSNHYLYTGQEYDSDVSGAEQYNLRARYYKTGIGRFTSEDPESQIGIYDKSSCENCIGGQHLMLSLYLSQIPNAYIYVQNNPTTYIDVEGQQLTIPMIPVAPDMTKMINPPEYCYNDDSTWLWLKCMYKCLGISDLEILYSEAPNWTALLEFRQFKVSHIKARNLVQPLKSSIVRRVNVGIKMIGEIGIGVEIGLTLGCSFSCSMDVSYGITIPYYEPLYYTK